MSFVSLLLITADRLADGIVTWKSVAFRLPSVFRFSPVVDPVVVATPVEVVPVVVGVVVFRLLCSVTVALVGGLRPNVRDLSLLTCMMAMSTITSGRALSRSSTVFQRALSDRGCRARPVHFGRATAARAVHRARHELRLPHPAVRWAGKDS